MNNIIYTTINNLFIIEPYIMNKNDKCLNSDFIKKSEYIINSKKFINKIEFRELKYNLRGLYFQNEKFSEKIIDVVSGDIYFVAVDLRIGSDTFCKYEGFRLSDKNKRQVYIPKGIAYGYLVISDKAFINQRFVEGNNPKEEEGILWNDKDLNIDWPIEEKEKINIVDNIKDFKTLKEFNSPFIYEERILSNDIYLEPIKEKDIENIRKWRNNEISNKVFFNNNYITSDAQIKWYDRYKENVSDRMFIIYFENNPVGTVALYDIDYKNGTAEFGRLLIGDINSRGKNIGISATKAICDYGFNRLHLNKIKLDVYKDNIKAVNLYKKVGFSEIKEKCIENDNIIVMEIQKYNIR